MTQREQTHFWHDDSFGATDLLSARYITHRFSPHIHEDEYAVGVCLQGAEAFKYRGSRHVCAAGMITLVNPGEVHDGEPVDASGWTYRMYYPNVETMRTAARLALGRETDYPFFEHGVVVDDYLFPIMATCHLVLEDPQTSVLEKESHMLWMLGQLILRQADFRPKLPTLHPQRPVVQQACDYIQANYAQPITLQNIADAVGMSRFHLLRLFKAEVGLPPHAYLNQVRIERGKTLLRSGHSLVDTAHATGFVDQSHFTNRFKRVVGITPGKFSRVRV